MMIIFLSLSPSDNVVNTYFFVISFITQVCPGGCGGGAPTPNNFLTHEDFFSYFISVMHRQLQSTYSIRDSLLLHLYCVNINRNKTNSFIFVIVYRVNVVSKQGDEVCKKSENPLQEIHNFDNPPPQWQFPLDEIFMEYT